LLFGKAQNSFIRVREIDQAVSIISSELESLIGLRKRQRFAGLNSMKSILEIQNKRLICTSDNFLSRENHYLQVI